VTLPPTATRASPAEHLRAAAGLLSVRLAGTGIGLPAITLRVAVANNTQPSVTNVTSVSGGGAAQAAAGTDPTTIGQLPALVVTGYPSAGGIRYAPFTRGGHGAGTYTVTVANDGYAATSAPVTFRAGLPAGLTAESITGGSGWSCSLSTATCTTKPGVHLAAGEQDQITVVVAVSTDAPPSADTLLAASGGGAPPAAAIDEKQRLQHRQQCGGVHCAHVHRPPNLSLILSAPALQVPDFAGHGGGEVHVEGLREDREADQHVGQFPAEGIVAELAVLVRALVAERPRTSAWSSPTSSPSLTAWRARRTRGSSLCRGRAGTSWRCA